MTKSASNEHIRLGATSTGNMAFICLHCGAIELPTMPISFDDFDKASRRFVGTHTNCPCPDSGAHNDLQLLIKAGLRQP